MAIKKIGELRGLDAHSTVILNNSQKSMLRKLGLNFTQDPVFSEEDYR